MLRTLTNLTCKHDHRILVLFNNVLYFINTDFSDGPLYIRYTVTPFTTLRNFIKFCGIENFFEYQKKVINCSHYYKIT